MTRRARVAIAIAVVLAGALFTACSHHSRSIKPTATTAKPGTALVVGDSLLFQSEVDLGNVANAAGWKIVMDGRPGSAITGGVSIGAWPPKIAELERTSKPDVAVVELGTNGCGTCTTVADAIDADLRPLRDVKRIYWVNVREIAPIPPDPHAINDAIVQATHRWPNLRVIDMNAHFTNHPEWIQPDRIHFTAAGGRQYAQLIMGAIANR